MDKLVNIILLLTQSSNCFANNSYVDVSLFRTERLNYSRALVAAAQRNKEFAC